MLIVITIFAVLLAPIAYFGWIGLLPLGFVIGSVAVSYLLSKAPNWLQAVGGVGILLMLAAMLLPAIDGGRVPAYRNPCLHNIKQLALAMHLYHDAHGHFPPAYVADANGRPMHSWRLLLLPYLEERKKYDAYRWDEPWNGPNNSKLADCPNFFRCPSDTAARNTPMTSYVVVGGPNTPFPGYKSTRFSDFALDGTSKSILIVEVANSGIHWMEPRDLNLQQMATTINAKQGQGISSTHGSGAVVAYADNHIEYLDASIPPEALRSLLTFAHDEQRKSRD